MVRFAEDEMSAIEKEAKKANIRTAEYIRSVTLNLDNVLMGKSEKEKTYSYDGAIKVLEGIFFKIINQLDKRDDKPEEVSIFMEKDSRGKTLIAIPELKFHLSFKQISK